MTSEDEEIRLLRTGYAKLAQAADNWRQRYEAATADLTACRQERLELRIANTKDKKMTTQKTFEAWCIVELFGHQKLAGRVTEASIGGCSLLRVDVPAVGDQSAYTRYFGPNAIYSITPVEEAIVHSVLAYLEPRPVDVYMLPQAAHANHGEEAPF